MDIFKYGHRLRDSFNYRRIPASLRDVNYLWYNAGKKVDLHKIPGFSEIAADTIAEGRTYLREDRLHTLWQALEQLNSTAPVVEIGTYRGGSARFLATALRAFGHGNRMLAFDTFEGHVVVDEMEDGAHVVGQFADVDYDEVLSYLRPYDVTVVKGDIFRTSQQIPSSIAFAHIDVDVYPVTSFCLDLLADRMAPGGMVVVDDYGFTTCPGAHKAVEEFLAGRGGWHRLHLLTGQAVLTKYSQPDD